jgi:hypothetical protein
MMPHSVATAVGQEHVGKSIAELEGYDCQFSGQPHQIRQRRHDRHHDHCLAGARRNKEINEILDGQHANTGD